MAERAGAVFAFDQARLPLYGGVAAALDRGVRTGGDPRNRDHVEAHVTIDPSITPAQAAIGYDPQTSGGLLAAVDPALADELAGQGFTVVGDVVPGDPRIVLR
jgi:selenide,water dikinase